MDLDLTGKRAIVCGASKGIGRAAALELAALGATVTLVARSEAGLRENIRVGVQYIEAWLGGRGAVPLYNLMEDAATAEICRAQIWQWIQHKAALDDGRAVTPELFKALLSDEMAKLRMLTPAAYDRGRFADAIRLFSEMTLAPQFVEFLTLPAYAELADHPSAVPAPKLALAAG